MLQIDATLLILRLTTAYVMLRAAWLNTRNVASWQWTKNETAILFGHEPGTPVPSIARLAAIAGMIMMYGGGLSILLGVEARIGGLLIAVFCLLGMRIHVLREREARAAGEAGNAMGWSAFGAHIAAGLKNWSLVGAGVAFVLLGAGRFSLNVDFLGLLLGFTS